MTASRSYLRAGLVVGITCLAANLRSAAAQTLNFSLDYSSFSIGSLATSPVFPITEGDVLAPAAGVPQFGPLALPDIAISAGFGPPGPGLGLAWHLPCAGHFPGPCAVEVDALSYGEERLTGPGFPLKQFLAFSVDRQAAGLLSNAFPDVLSEAAVFDAAADVFLDLDLGVGPIPPYAGNVLGNVGVVDGNGMISGSGATYKGIGLVDGPAPSDNLDALGVWTQVTAFPIIGVYFSLDDNFQDPMTGMWNSGSAQAHGFMGADVLHSAGPGGPPVLYAPAFALGLNLTPANDDLDALVVRENGTPGFQPSQIPNDWMGGATDMVLFSVRRGSGLIGFPDSIFGLPIAEGDILTTPMVGGLSVFPGIYVAAENLGLVARIAGMPNDDLDALSLLPVPLNDCNGNGVEDVFDISSGTSWDTNGNGVPDECELLTRGFCYCDSSSTPPCGNFYAPGGCVNSTGLGAIESASGTTSVVNDNIVLNSVQLPPNKPTILLLSKTVNAGVTFKDGILCLSGQIFRMGPKVSSPSGTVSYGPGLVAQSFSFGPNGWILQGSTWNFQTYYRDILLSPCLQRANITNVIQATFTP
jgi:hypothetical protein